MVNIDQFHWLTRGDIQDLLATAHQEIGAEHVRACAMYAGITRVLERDPKWQGKPIDPNGRTNFRITDYVFDSLLDHGLRPVFTTCFMPPSMASTAKTVWNETTFPSPPKSPAAWQNFVSEHIKHTIQRYGRNEVREWYFECWNEPNLEPFFDGSKEEFFQLWKQTWLAVKKIDPEIRFGGPSTARAEWIEEFLEFCEKEKCQPDFLVAHVYNNDSGAAPLSPFAGPESAKIVNSPHFSSGVFKGTRKMIDRLGFKGELHWNEWGRSCHICDPVRETAHEAAYLVKSMAECSNTADYFAYWNLSDVYDQLGYGKEAFHGNYGMVTLDGLRKPHYHAQQLLQRIGHNRVSVVGGSDDHCINAIITKDQDRISILVYAMHPNAGNPLKGSVEVEIEVPTSTHKVSMIRVSETENNAYHHWQQIGAPDYPSRKEVQDLRAKDQLESSEDWKLQSDQASDSHLLSYKMKTPGIVLIQALI